MSLMNRIKTFDPESFEYCCPEKTRTSDHHILSNMTYIRSIEIVYNDSKNAIDGVDLNNGIHGTRLVLRPRTYWLVDERSCANHPKARDSTSHVDKVYLVATKTDNKRLAATSFVIEDEGEIDGGQNLRGAPSEVPPPGGYRYLLTGYYREPDAKPITEAYLKKDPKGYEHTDNLNKDREGDSLYLCWKCEVGK